MSTKFPRLPLCDSHTNAFAAANCADNSFLYIVSLAAGVRLANATGDSAHAREWQAALVRGVKAIDNHLWLDNAGYYQGVYCMQDPANGQVYGDSLYGLSWAVTLHLVPQLEAAGLRIDRVQSHLRVERKINLTPYGLRFSSPLPPNTTFSCPSIPTPSRRQNGFYAEDDIWPAASASWTTLAIALNVTSSADDAFEVLGSMVTTYRDQIHDQWDFRDLGTANATGVGPSPDETVPFRPVCNSHYGRQLNIWQAVAAWSGLRFDAHWTSPGADTTNAGGSKGLLALVPHPSAHQFPVLLPTGNGVVTLTADGQRIELIRWLSGELDVAAITLHESVLASEVRLRAGQLWPGSV